MVRAHTKQRTHAKRRWLRANLDCSALPLCSAGLLCVCRVLQAAAMSSPVCTCPLHPKQQQTKTEERRQPRSEEASAARQHRPQLCCLRRSRAIDRARRCRRFPRRSQRLRRAKQWDRTHDPPSRMQPRKRAPRQQQPPLLRPPLLLILQRLHRRPQSPFSLR